MLFRDFLTQDRIVGDLIASTREEALAELAEPLFVTGVLDSGVRDGVMHALLKREEIHTTALGNGMDLAVPHARHPAVRELVGVLGRSHAGVDFGSPDGQPVHLFVLLLSHPDSPVEHLQALAYISRKLRGEDMRGLLLRAAGEQQIKRFLDGCDNEG